MDVDLRHCRCALALAEHRSFRRAAVALGITQPSLSRTIQQLEGEVGATLFTRSREGIEPTDVGRVFLVRAQEVVARATDLTHEMELIGGAELGELRIGASVYALDIYIADAVARMAREHPAVTLVVVPDVSENLVMRLRRREFDLIIADAAVCEPKSEFDLETLTWHQVHFVVRSGHPLLTSEAPTLQEILSFPLLTTSRTAPDILSAMHEARGTPPASAARPFPAVRCDSMAASRSVVANSDCVCWLPMNVIAEDLRAGRLAVVPFDTSHFGRAYSIITIANRTPDSAARAFMGFLRESDAAAALVNNGPGSGPER